MRFKPANTYTQTCFNAYGFKPYDAVEECTMHEAGFVQYDLTVLQHRDGHYLAAHGQCIAPDTFSSAAAARAWLRDWYASNRAPVAARA